MPTATGLRISSVNGTALLDNCPSDITDAAGTGAILNVYDASSRLISGLIDSVGSSEGLTDNPARFASINLSDGTWTIWGTSVTVNDANTFTVNATLAGFGNNLTMVLGELWKSSLDYTVVSGSYTAPLRDAAGTFAIYAINGAGARYITVKQTNLCLLGEGAVASVVDINSISMQKVIAPSSSGVVIKDLSGNQNWISKDASTTITLGIPTNAVILGCQLRTDAALADGEIWDAAYSGGSTEAICTAQAVAKNTKVNSFVTDITDNTTNIAITKNGGGDFTAQGTIRAIVYTEEFDAMGDAA